MFNPIDKAKQSYKLYTLCTEIKDFIIKQTYKIKLPFEPDEQKQLCSYGNCIVYDTVVFDNLAGGPNKWISTNALEFELN